MSKPWTTHRRNDGQARPVEANCPPTPEVPAGQAFTGMLQAAGRADRAASLEACAVFLASIPACALDGKLAIQSRYEGCVAGLSAKERAWHVEGFEQGLATRFPRLDLKLSSATVLARLDRHLGGLPADEALEGRALAAMVMLLATAPAPLKGEPAGVASFAPYAVSMPVPVPGREVWVRGRSVQMTWRDDALASLAVGGTVGLMAFLVAYCELVNVLVPAFHGRPGPTVAASLAVGVVTAGLWALYLRLSLRWREKVADFVGDAGLWLPGLAFGVAGMAFLAHGMTGAGGLMVALGGLSTWLYRSYG